MKRHLYTIIAILSLSVLLPACQSSRSGKSQSGQTAPTATVSSGSLDIYPDFASERSSTYVHLRKVFLFS